MPRTNFCRLRLIKAKNKDKRKIRKVLSKDLGGRLMTFKDNGNAGNNTVGKNMEPKLLYFSMLSLNILVFIVNIVETTL
jgi:hypothetical protein